MTMLLSAFGLAGRFAGDLLTSALSWASSLLFGRVPRTHQIFLVLMMAGSFTWLLVVLGLLIPGIASWLFAATPHPPFIDQAWLAAALIVALLLLPPFVGAAGYMVPAAGERPGGIHAVAEIARGYLLTPVIAGLLIFLAGVGISRKIRSARHGWSDVHVPVVLEAGAYERLVTDLTDALASAGLHVTVDDAPRVLTLPAWILTRLAGANVRKLRPDRLVELEGRDLRIGVYPSDIAISGKTHSRTRARAAILSRLAATTAHLTTSAEAQKVEDSLKAVATVGAHSSTTRHGIRSALDDVDAALLTLAIPTDEWDILYRLRLQVERDQLAGTRPGTDFPGHVPGTDEASPAGAGGHPMTSTDTPPRPAPDAVPRLSDRGRLIGTASFILFILLTIAVGMQVAFGFDAPILAWGRTYAGYKLFWDVMSQSANFPLIGIAVVYVLWLFYKKRRREAVLVMLMLAAVTAGSEGVKQLTGRPRPSGSGDGIPGVVFSYPSGHVLEAMTILGLLVVRVWRGRHELWARLGFAALVAVEVILVAIARLALNEHFPTDILAGVFGAMGTLGWYAWLTRPGGWADRPTAEVFRREADEADGAHPASPRVTDHQPKRAAA